MKDSHLALRLPADLASALQERAELEQVSKSQVAREAVARYLAPGAPVRTLQPEVTSREVAERWIRLPHLATHEAADWAADLDQARETLPPGPSPWG